MNNDDNMRMFEWNEEEKQTSDWRSGFSSTNREQIERPVNPGPARSSGSRNGMPDFKWDSVNRNDRRKPAEPELRYNQRYDQAYDQGYDQRYDQRADSRSNEDYIRRDPVENKKPEQEEDDNSPLVTISREELEALKRGKAEIIESQDEGFIEFKGVTKNYTMGEMEIRALDGINFKIKKGEIVIVVGASGAGKSTILNIMGGMDRQSSGEIIVDGEKISSYTDKQMVMFRRYDVGFVFQFYNLVPNLTAKENVELATQISKFPLDVDKTMVAVGLEDRVNNFPSQLSGGEQQRVAIARALAKNPKLLLCDEPTGALDYNTGKAILKLLQDTARINGMTVIIITHNYALTGIGDRVIKVKNGKIEAIETNRHPMDIADVEW